MLNANWKALYQETVAMREACGEAKLKSILAIGEVSYAHSMASLLTPRF